MTQPGAVLCLDIGGTAIKPGLATDPATIRRGASVATPLHAFDDFVAALAEVATREAGPEAPLSISVTGVVDPATGVIRCANIPCIDERPLARDLSGRLGRPVFVANDADCFALAEATVGAGKGHRVVFGIILGTGVGGGVVIDGRLHLGAGGLTGEWGHGQPTALRAGEPPREIPRLPCGCGLTGCLDTVGAARGLERLHEAFHGIKASSEAIVRDAEAGVAAALATVDAQIDLLAGPLALATNLLGPTVIPVGGGLSHAPWLIDRLDRATRALIYRRTTEPLVVPGRCTVEAGLVGAAVLGFQGLAS